MGFNCICTALLHCFQTIDLLFSIVLGGWVEVPDCIVASFWHPPALVSREFEWSKMNRSCSVNCSKTCGNLPTNLTELCLSVSQKLLEASPEQMSGDAAWILTSAFIIFTMQSGFGLLEAGEESIFWYLLFYYFYGIYFLRIFAFLLKHIYGFFHL